MKSGRVVCVFGLPCSGKTTLINVLIGSSKEILARISSGDIARELSSQADTQHMAAGNLFPHEDTLRARILDLINKRRAAGSEAIFLDGVPRTASQCVWLVEQQFVGAVGDGMIIQIVGDDLIKRAKSRFRDDQDSEKALIAKINKQQSEISALEREIFRYGIPYYTVMNTDLTIATKTLAKFVGLRK